MKFADKLATVGLMLSIGASMTGLLFQGSNLVIVDAAGWVQILALLLVLVGGVRGSRWWLLALLLITAGGYLWLLEQGH